MALDPAGSVGPAGWTTRADLLTRVSRGTLDTWTARGRLVRLHAGIYATPEAAGAWQVRVTAALAARPDAVASHGTALALWGLVDPPPGPLHMTVGPSAAGAGRRTWCSTAPLGRWGSSWPVDCRSSLSRERWSRPGAMPTEHRSAPPSVPRPSPPSADGTAPHGS